MIVERDFYALLIPSGTAIKILAGTVAEITQFKGGTATIYFNGNLARVSNSDLDAIGIKSELINQKPVAVTSNLSSVGEIDLDLVWQALKECYDPEIPINIVDLGLIYDCRIIDKKVIVDMTLTAPMCGMGPVLVEDVKNILSNIAHVEEVIVQMVFDPPWTTDRMSEAAKIELGLI